MSGRIRYTTAGGVPDVIELKRNRRPISAERVLLGEIEVADRAITIADPSWVDETPRLPVRIENGVYPVYAYQWMHRSGPVNVCIVLYLSRDRWTVPRRLRIPNDIRPDLTEGVMVDTGEVAISGGNKIITQSGCGDGYYPVVANRSLRIRVQSIVVDFEVHRTANYGVGHGFKLDEYGIPILPEE